MSDAPAAEPVTVRRGWRFATRLMVLLLALVLLSQAVAYVAVSVAVGNAVDAQLARELEVGERVWNETEGARLRRLFEQVSVLAEDFGLREAIASADQPTIDSAIANAGARIGVPYAIALAVDGRIVAAKLPNAVRLGDDDVAQPLAAARRDGFAVGIAALAREPVAYALVPVQAPDLIGWVGMAAPFGPEELEDFRAVTGLDAAVVVGPPCVLAAAIGDLRGWQVPAPVCARLAGPEARQSLRDVAGDPTEPALGLRLSAAEAARVSLVLRASRQRALAPFRDLQLQALLITAAAAVLVLLVAVGIGRRVSRPLQAVSAAAARVVGGNYAEPIRVEGGDEIAELADAFNRMQTGIAERERQLLYQAGHDGLTGLPNRERALLELTRLLGDADDRRDRAGAVVILDLRGFRRINDLLGHAFGDQVLVEVARRLQAQAAPAQLARLGGNEFLLVRAGLDADAAAAWVGTLLASLGGDLAIQGQSLQVEWRAGMACFPGSGFDANTLVRRADIALDEAKRRECALVVYTQGHDEKHLRQLRLIGDLRHVAGSGGLSLVYQPKVALADGAVTHAECLLRWRHPQLGGIAPDEFITLAERANLIRPITRYVLARALDDAAAWRESGLDCGIAVNLSALDLVDETLPDYLAAELQRSGGDARRLILEVTESAVMRDLPRAIEVLQRCRRLGARISIDDFGTGHSSLAQLRRLPVDELKIDKSFVMPLVAGSEDEQIVHSIIELAHALSLHVVAEGVESAAGLEVLRRLGCETVQGYHFSRPLPSAEFLAWCRHRRGFDAAAARD